MQLRAPAYPLITVDPYFSVWSPSNKLNESNTVHWTNSPNTISGIATVDGKKYSPYEKRDNLLNFFQQREQVNTLVP